MMSKGKEGWRGLVGKGNFGVEWGITGNVHIEYCRGHSNCGEVRVMPHCASCRSLSLENAIYMAGTGRAGPYLYGSNAVSCGSVGGVLTQE